MRSWFFNFKAKDALQNVRAKSIQCSCKKTRQKRKPKTQGYLATDCASYPPQAALDSQPKGKQMGEGWLATTALKPREHFAHIFLPTPTIETCRNSLSNGSRPAWSVIYTNQSEKSSIAQLATSKSLKIKRQGTWAHASCQRTVTDGEIRSAEMLLLLSFGVLGALCLDPCLVPLCWLRLQRL